jgi:hypothetical protein
MRHLEGVPHDAVHRCPTAHPPPRAARFRRGEFIPGLSALDSSAQIVSWAIVFGYAQQLFTRFVDQQGNTVLASVRGGPTSVTRPAEPAG